MALSGFCRAQAISRYPNLPEYLKNQILFDMSPCDSLHQALLVTWESISSLLSSVHFLRYFKEPER